MTKTFKIKLSPVHDFFIDLKTYFLSYQRNSNNELLRKYNLEANVDTIINSIIFSLIEEVKYTNPDVDLDSEVNVVIYEDSDLCFDNSINKALKEQNIGELLFELTNIVCSYMNEQYIQQKYLIK